MKNILITEINDYRLEAIIDGTTYTVDRVFDISTIDRFNYNIASDATLFGSKLLHKLFGIKRPLENFITEEILLIFAKEDNYPFTDIAINMIRMLYIELGILKTGDCLLSVINHSDFKYALVFRGPKEWHNKFLLDLNNSSLMD